MENTKIIDGFIYAIINPEEAKEKLKSGDSIFRLYEDGTESLIEDENDLNDAFIDKNQIGIEIDFESELIKEYTEGEQNRFRNNNWISFENWLENKIENIKN